MKQHWLARISFCVALLAGVIGSATLVRAADDTARFNGTWRVNFPYNGQTLTLASVHTGNSFKNYVILPNGSLPAGDGTFSAADGKYTITSDKGNDTGTYQFTDDKTVACTTSAGITAVWKRDDTPIPPMIQPPAPPAPVAPVPAPPVQNPTPAAVNPLASAAPAPDPADVIKNEILSKIQEKNFNAAFAELNSLGAINSTNPWLCVTEASVLMQLEDYTQARGAMTFFLQHTYDNAAAYVMHAQACAAMGDQRWADIDLGIAKQLRPATAEADRQSVAAWAAVGPKGFAPDEIPGQLDALVKMAGRHEDYETLVTQAMRIVKGEYNIRKVERDDYREGKRQLIAACLADPAHAQPLVNLASYLFEQSSAIHGDGRADYAIVAYRYFQPTLERETAMAAADAALRIDPNNVDAMAIKAGALVALGDDDHAQPIMERALSINPNQPELLRMFSGLMTRIGWSNSDAGDALSQPLTWEDDQYYYIQQRSPQDLSAARDFNNAAAADAQKSIEALQAAIDATKGTAAGYYYLAVQCHRNREQDKNAYAQGAEDMEQAVKLDPTNVDYRDFLAELYSHMGWRRETDFFTQWSAADNIQETSAAKMIRLAYMQLRRREFDPARQSLAEAMRIDPADPRGPANMGLLIAGENNDRGQVEQSVTWLMAASALEEADVRLLGARHPSSEVTYMQHQVGLEFTVATETATRLLTLHRAPEAALIARNAADDAERVDKAVRGYAVTTAMLPLVSLQGSPAPHMDPLNHPQPISTILWLVKLHELAGNACQAAGQPDEAAKQFAAEKQVQHGIDEANRNAPPPPQRR